MNLLHGAFLSLLALPAQAEVLEGPLPARYVACSDGDSCTFDVRIWLDQTVRTAVRLRGVDAPEIRGKCDAERAMARSAADVMRGLLSSAIEIELLNVADDKYGGRVLADIVVDGQQAADLLLQLGLARPYGGGRREGWCDG